MNYAHEAIDLPPFALAAYALALFALGSVASGPVLGGILATATAIVCELARYRLDGSARLIQGAKSND